MQERTADEIIEIVMGISGNEDNFFTSVPISKELCKELLKNVATINKNDDEAEKDKLKQSGCLEVLGMLYTAYYD